MTPMPVEQVWRRETPHVLAALLRRHGDLGDCEDATQEALLAAARQWPVDGMPDNPRGWLIRVASRRLIDQLRSDLARTERELADAQSVSPADARVAPADARALGTGPTDDDDTLEMLLLCCHPVLSCGSQVALTLRAVGGLSTAQIAAAFLVPETTMGQRVSRARATLARAGARFTPPSPQELPLRVAAVLDVLYLVFNEGYTRSGGDGLVDVSLTDEAMRLTRWLHGALPDHDEVAGALALMLLTGARTAARTDAAGDLIPLAEQDRSRWDHDRITEGTALLERLLPRGHVGRFQLQAAIAAVHAEAPTAADTDWRQIAVLYDMLERVAPGPAVRLNRAVAVGMAFGPEHGLAALDALADDAALRRGHRIHAVRAHLLELSGDPAAAATEYTRAARLTASLPEQRYLNQCAARAARERPDRGDGR